MAFYEETRKRLPKQTGLSHFLVRLNQVHTLGFECEI